VKLRYWRGSSLVTAMNRPLADSCNAYRHGHDAQRSWRNADGGVRDLCPEFYTADLSRDARYGSWSGVENGRPHEEGGQPKTWFRASAGAVVSAISEGRATGAASASA
jgi:hypothetical protein